MENIATNTRRTVIATVVSSLACFGPISILAESSPAFSAEKVIQAEKNPPGDIPDTQVFIDYASPHHFMMKVPEGWARSDRADGASFVDKLDGVIVSVSKAATAPTIESVKTNEVPNLKTAGRAVTIASVEAVKLPAGPAIRIVYNSNSEPNAVTDKQVRLENERYLYFKDGELVTVELYAPKGADNVDQWQLMSKSFRWN
ncbi:hypothetical protein [Rhizobium lusitanum]|uniref:Lipoprotein n=1 Tax=Rhizobium lusitanum TaxID=293958 RepID=A0A1C3WDS8_9HYPH|nr:hypothetical protein [Rhizobium lusitanum]SCB38180.1 hypothetical protein GA0061101_110144 [Rhizobium lusitanum]